MPPYAQFLKTRALYALLVFFLVCGGAARAQEKLSLDNRYVVDGAVVWLSAEDDGSLFCVSDASALRIANTMKLAWKNRLGSRPVLVFRQKDGVILTATRRFRVEGYSRIGERVIDFALPWQDAAASALLALGETAEGYIYVFRADGGWAIFSRGGSLLAQGKTPQPPTCPPVSYRGRIIYAAPDGNIRAISASGRPAWETGPGDPVLRLTLNPFTSSLVVSRKGGSLEIYGSEPDDSPTGPPGEESPRLLRQRNLPFEPTRIMGLAAGGFVLAGSGGRILTLDDMGATVEDFILKDSRPAATLTDGANAVFFAEDRGAISSYTLGGSSLWTTSLRGKPTTLALSPSARYLAVGTEDWIIQRFEFIQYGRNIPRVAPALPPPDPLKINTAASAYRGEYDFIYFMDRAASPDGEKKKECLRIAAERLDRGQLQLSLDYVSEVLRYLAAEPYNLHGARSFPEQRAGALELLARMGDAVNRDFFAALLAREKDPYILSAVLAAMAAQASDPDETMRRSIHRYTQSLPQPDSRRSAAIIQALDDISRYHGSLGQYGRAALMQLQPLVLNPLRQRIQNLLTTRP
ncbi:MAG: hypothetical protein FWG35_06740 [Spirochaetaceae bacterium]|nr:hypothetical protein [Spirochaetaceae bacterium]